MSNLMPPGWSAHQAPDGRWYYSHAPSGVTQWNPPLPQHPQHPQHPPNPQHQNSYSVPHHQYTAPHQQYSTTPPNPQHQQQHLPHQQNHQIQHRNNPPSGYPGHAPPIAPSHQFSPSHHASMSTHNPHLPHHMASAAQRYVYSQAVEFKLKEKAFSLSGDSFSIKNAVSGESVFKVKGNVLSFKDSKALYDMQGVPIYKMAENIISLRGRMVITDAATKKSVISLRKKGFIPMMGTSTIQAWCGDSDDGEPYLECKGDLFRKDFSIKEKATGRVVASVKRKSFSLSNILLEKDTYIIRIEPGMDAALLVFFVIAIDEQYRDDGERRGYSSFF